MQTCNLLRFYLECVLRVVQAVHSDVILHGRAGDGAEDGELEALGGGGAQGLAHQAVRAQRLGQDVAGLVVHLNVARRGEVLLAHHNHVLRWRQEKHVTVLAVGKNAIIEMRNNDMITFPSL